MRAKYLILVSLSGFALSGCLAKTALDVATAPVRAASQAADWATTSQDEADRSRGREIRRREENVGQLEGDYRKLSRDCEAGDDTACREAVAVRREIDQLVDGLPLEQ